MNTKIYCMLHVIPDTIRNETIQDNSKLKLSGFFSMKDVMNLYNSEQVVNERLLKDLMESGESVLLSSCQSLPMVELPKLASFSSPKSSKTLQATTTQGSSLLYNNLLPEGINSFVKIEKISSPFFFDGQLEYCDADPKSVVKTKYNYYGVKFVYLYHNGIRYSLVNHGTYKCIDKKCNNRIVVHDGMVKEFYGHKNVEHYLLLPPKRDLSC